MTINLKNLLNPKIKISKMGEFQELKKIQGLSISAVSADLYGDGSIKIIFTPGHSPGHQSILIKLPKSGNILLTIDAAYTVDHWENKCLPGLVTSSSQAAESVKKLRKIAKEHNALVVTGHDPDAWKTFKKAPMFYYD